MKKNEKGFGVIGVITIVVVIGLVGFGGWYVRHKKQVTQSPVSTRSSSKSTRVDTYKGWKTYRLATSGLGIKYPPDWTVLDGSEGDTGIEITSPTKAGYYFVLSLEAGGSADIDQNFLGDSLGVNVLNLDVPGSSAPLYLVAQTRSTGDVNGLGLATAPGGTSTSFGILDDGGHGTDNIVMNAYLIAEGDRPSNNQPHSLQAYQSQSDYQTLLSIFKSLNYE